MKELHSSPIRRMFKVQYSVISPGRIRYAVTLAILVSARPPASRNNYVRTTRPHPPPRIPPAPAACRPSAIGNVTIDASGLTNAGGGWGQIAKRAGCLRLVVLGGSMTCGGNLVANSKGARLKLAWPGLLETKLRRSFGRGVVVLNKCTGASSLTWAVPQLSKKLPPRTDVLIVDYVQNDNRPTVTDEQDGGRSVDASTRVAAEALIVAVDALSRARKEPPPAILFFCTVPPPNFHRDVVTPGSEWPVIWADKARGPAYAAILHRHQAIYANVSRFHDISAVAMQFFQKLWPTPLETAGLEALPWRAPRDLGGLVDHHPGAKAHEFAANAVHQSLLALTQRAERGEPTLVRPWSLRKERLSSANELAQISACHRGIFSQHSAEDAANTTLRNVLAAPSWVLARDRPGKPFGWIHNGGGGGALSFVLGCGPENTIGLEFLKSYGDMGKISVEVKAIAQKKVKFSQALCADHDECAAFIAADPKSDLVRSTLTAEVDANWHQMESLAKIESFKFTCYNWRMHVNPVVVTIRPLPKATRTINGTLPTNHGKFKLLSIFTC